MTTSETRDVRKKFITGIELVNKLCEACNINPQVTRHVTIDVDVNNVVTVTATVDMYGTADLEGLGWEEMLKNPIVPQSAPDEEKTDGPEQ